MSEFTKSDLLYIEKYTWKQKETEQDTLLLDRSNGHEVLSFANSYAKRYFQSPLKGDLHKIEYMLAYRVPGDLDNRSYIASFINSNW